MKIIKQSNLAKTVVVFAIAIFVLSLSISAQEKAKDNLGDKKAKALVKELTEVVRKSSPKKEEAEAVFKRWEKRKNLAQKTKAEAIELLYEDVKFEIKDSGTQYQIYSTFAFYKNTDIDLGGSETSENKLGAILFDEFQYQNSEDFMARFDAFAIALQDNPENKGYVIIYGDKKSYANKEKEVREYSARRLGSENLKYLKGEGNSKVVIAFWSVPKGAKPPTPRNATNQNESIKNEIIALEKEAWKSWKNKDLNFFKTLLADDAISVNSSGVFDKKQTLEFYASCEVKSYSLDDFKFRMLDKNSALITFRATQDAVCGGEKNPSNIRVSSVYVKRNGKWQNILYMETAGNK